MTEKQAHLDGLLGKELQNVLNGGLDRTVDWVGEVAALANAPQKFEIEHCALTQTLRDRAHDLVARPEDIALRKIDVDRARSWCRSTSRNT